MPNVTISDLPPATLPLDAPNSFFEVQTIESGEQVSRKVSSDNITISSGNITGTGVVSPTAGTPYDYDALLTYENANSETTATIGWNGSAFNILQFARGSTFLLQILNAAGGPIRVMQADPDGAVTFQAGSAVALELSPAGGNDVRIRAVTGSSPNDLLLRWIEGSFIQIEQAHIGFDASDTFIVNNLLNSVELWDVNAAVARTTTAGAGGLLANNTLTGGGFERVLTASDLGVVADPLTIGQIIITNTNQVDLTDSDVALVVAGAGTARHIEIARGTFGQAIQSKTDATTVDTLEINRLGGDVGVGSLNNSVAGGVRLNHSTGAASGTIIETTTAGIILEGITGSNTILDFHAPGANLVTRVVHNGANFQFDGFQNSTEFQFQSRNSGGTIRQLLHMDPDTDVEIYHPPSAAIVIETHTPATGGAFVNNTLTGAGLERVLTTSDLGGGAQISGTPANNQLAVWVNSTDIEGDSELTWNANVLALNEGLRIDVLHATQSPSVTVRNTAAGGLKMEVLSGSGVMQLRQLSAAGGNEDIIIAAVRNSFVQMYHNNTPAARTLAVASGGFEVDNQSTGAGFERVLTTSDLAGVGLTAYKTSTETINNDSTVNDDTDLQIAMVANERYTFEMFFDFGSSNAGDFQFQVRGPTGFNLDGLFVVGIEDTIQQVTQASSHTIDTTNPAFQYHITITGKITATASGNVRFRWAQGTSDAGNTSLFVGSWMRIQQLT